MDLVYNGDRNLVDILGSKTPIVLAPMAGASGGALASAVTLAGGFGFVAAGYDIEQFVGDVRRAKDALKDHPVGFGVGFLVWQLEKFGASVAESLVRKALDEGPKAVWFSFGADLGRWVKFSREYRADVKVFVQVSDLAAARKAIEEWKVDVLVAQGVEAGGHGYSQSLPTKDLVSLIKGLLPSDGPVLLAAGGVGTGADIASFLSLGASGVVIGTRFLCTPECLYSPEQKELLVNAQEGSTIRTMSFDNVRGTLGWPEGVNGRAVFNDTVRDYDAGVPLDDVRARYDVKDGKRLLAWAGTGVGASKAVEPAGDVLRQLHRDMVAVSIEAK